MTRKDFIEKFNALYQTRQAFAFLVDFEMNRFYVMTENEMLRHRFWLQFENKTIAPDPESTSIPSITKINPVSYEIFEKKFNKVMHHLRRGDTYLLNLTFKTPVDLQGNLIDVFYHTDAKYKVYFDDKFVFFSPEAFVIIEEGIIRTFPMKGTAPARPGAKEKLLNNNKEMYEHNTVVDLLRNDLAGLSKDVTVARYRYVDLIRSGKEDLLQVSSEITGFLDFRWNENPARSLLRMLPAGSVSGAPKKRTLEIIARIEAEPREFYTGITGYFDGKKLTSAVNIRYIEKHNGKYFYRSGGGITALSNPKDEYDEYLKKIYLPFA